MMVLGWTGLQGSTEWSN